ncbi:hypothetical protein ABK040_000570 [Willaertia magna]
MSTAAASIASTSANNNNECSTLSPHVVTSTTSNNTRQHGNHNRERMCVVCSRTHPPTIFSCRYKVHPKNCDLLCGFFERELNFGELCDRCYRLWYKHKRQKEDDENGISNDGSNGKRKKRGGSTKRRSKVFTNKANNNNKQQPSSPQLLNNDNNSNNNNAVVGCNSPNSQERKVCGKRQLGNNEQNNNVFDNNANHNVNISVPYIAMEGKSSLVSNVVVNSELSNNPHNFHNATSYFNNEENLHLFVGNGQQQDGYASSSSLASNSNEATSGQLLRMSPGSYEQDQPKKKRKNNAVNCELDNEEEDEDEDITYPEVLHAIAASNRLPSIKDIFHQTTKNNDVVTRLIAWNDLSKNVRTSKRKGLIPMRSPPKDDPIIAYLRSDNYLNPQRITNDMFPSFKEKNEILNNCNNCEEKKNRA